MKQEIRVSRVAYTDPDGVGIGLMCLLHCNGKYEIG
jgi:hypothetical protein